MRWTDKPRKKTKREIVLEYIKFMKIMGYYPKLIAYMYSMASMNNSYASGRLSNNQAMIGYFERILVRCGTHIRSWVIKEYFIYRPLGMNVFNYHSKLDPINDLLWSYFKDKHIDNCIIID